jgi:BirA family biotin operon repressor/biotin-[acetyl-CoA-carboxylase] ligase
VSKIKIDNFQKGLRTKRFGRSILFCQEVDSTNEWAKELAAFGAAEGTVAVAETQTAGHGRLGREWFSPKGGLWFSIILRPKLIAREATKLVFTAGLAVAEVLRKLYALRIETKWPNDVMVEGRKICGILAEMNTTGETVNYVIVGIGLNANINVKDAFPPELAETATSLETKLGREVNIVELFRALIEKFEGCYDLFNEKGFASILAEWKKNAVFLGSDVEVTLGTETLRGVAVDVDDDGSLIIRLEDGKVKHVYDGDVSLKSS